jgi:shikimate kinase
MAELNKRKPLRVYLVGFSGSGKSTVGRRLARRIKVPFFDTDAMIERKAKKSIASIFRDEGERAFRRTEAQMISQLCGRSNDSFVAALGGGAFQSAANRNLLLASGTVVYLSASVRELYRRLRPLEDRPLLNVRPKSGQTPRTARLQKIHSLLESRSASYRKAHVVCPTTGYTITEIVNTLMKLLRRYHG